MNRNQAFKDRLQRALEKSRLGTQKALADVMGVREATVSGWFNGAWPREDQLVGLIDALGVSGHWLVAGEGPMRPDFETDAIRLEVIGLIVDEEVDPLALKQFAETTLGRARDDVQAQIETEALGREGGPRPVEPEESDGSDEGDPQEDHPKDGTNGPPNKNRHAGP